MEAMTDRQFNKMFEMWDMILDGCKDIPEAKQKLRILMDRDDKKSQDNVLTNHKEDIE